MKKIKLQADIVNGILLVDDFDEYFDELTDENILLACLKDESCLPIYAEVSKNTLNKILEEGYNIRQRSGCCSASPMLKLERIM